MKINIKKLFFRAPDKIDESSVEIEVVVDEKTKTELFNDELNKLVKAKLVDTLGKKLTKMCYTDEEWEQTLEARDYKGDKDVSDLFPKAICWHTRGFGMGLMTTYKCTFNLDRFCEVLVGDL